MSLSIGMVYSNWKRRAEAEGWKLPGPDDPFGMEAWIVYWCQCDEHQRHPEGPRPVAPHRSGGGEVAR